MASISDIEGIGTVQAEKLGEVSIKTTDSLLSHAGKAAARRELSVQTGIPETKLLEWVNRADLYRISGIGSEISDLLEAAGVDSVPELATRNPENLFQSLQELNDKKKIVRSVPSVKEITVFIEEANTLPKVVFH